MENKKLSRNSSLLVSKYALLVWAGLAVFAAAMDYSALAALFLLFLLLFSFARYWASRAMDGVSLEIACERCQLFPGMETVMEYELRNDKLLPLIWLELSQQRAEKDCVIPDESFEAYVYQADEEDRVYQIDAYKRSFSLVMGYESITLSSKWRAQCRGIYRPERLLLRSGDGFGLSQVEKHYPSELLPEIVVYPKRVPVDGELFLRQDWDKSYGAAGFKEDMSVLRGLRPYSSADSWKRINWRMAARQPGELQVNFYETVQPASALFILDGESYCQNDEALESDLEVLASLIELLSSKGVNCGLCLSKSRSYAALSFSPEQQLSAAELLYYLAGFECLKTAVLDKEQRPTDKFESSVFDLTALGRAAMESGTVALFTNDASKLSPELMERLDAARLIVFSSGPLDCPDKELRILHVSSLRKGEIL